MKELSVLMLTLSPLALILIFGFSNAARCRIVTGTPVTQRKQQPFLRHLGRSDNNYFGSNLKRMHASPIDILDDVR